MKTFYRFDKETKEYLHDETCMESPREKGEYLKPIIDGVCVVTDIKPPKIKAGLVRCFDGVEWIYEEDHRKDVAYSKLTGEVVKIETLGEIPNELTYKKPINFGLWSDKNGKWVIDSESKEIFRIEELKRVKKDSLQNATVEVDGKTFDARTKDIEAIKDGIERNETRWILADDTVAEVDSDVLGKVLKAITKKRQSIINKYIKSMENK